MPAEVGVSWVWECGAADVLISCVLPGHRCFREVGGRTKEGPWEAGERRELDGTYTGVRREFRSTTNFLLLKKQAAIGQ